ncbi:MAG TPA: hypothetical protein DCS93_34195 [Microscillaceae bacterium]|nr:hypothetical protein [Microscillaceae bacterium]
MEKEDLQKFINEKEREKEDYEDRIDFFQDLLKRGELAGKNRVDAEMNIVEWKEYIRDINNELVFLYYLMNS